MGENMEAPQSPLAKFIGEWADTLGKLIALFGTIGGIVLGWFAYSKQVVSTWSLTSLTSSAWGMGLGAVFLIGLGAWFLYSKQRWLGGALLGLGAICLALLLFIMVSWPAAVTWTLQEAPYPLTIKPGSPLVAVKDQLNPPGFPGHESYEAELLKKCPAQKSFAQRYVVYVSSEFAKNRFPQRITAKDQDELALAGFAFHRESTKDNAWKAIDRFGFEQVTGFVKLNAPDSSSARFSVALVLFPLTAARARDFKDLEQYVEID